MFGLSFLSPLFLIGAAAAAIPIVIHLLNRRTEPVVEFAAMRYLRQAPVEQSRRRRLRELLLLALRVSALVLLACAFARPYVAGSAATGPATVVLVDTSASVSAPGQFERAKDRAAAIIRDTPASHAVAVLAFAHAADLVAPLAQDRAGALAALARLEPGAGATHYAAALERAVDVFAGRPGRLVVVTDLQQTGWDAASRGVPDNIAIEVEEIDGPAANIAVSALRVEGREAVAVVHNYSPGTVTEQVIFTIDDRRVGAVPVLLQPGGSADARLAIDAGASGALSASIGDPDGYAADNVRYAVLDPAGAISVLALTASGRPAEALYLARALAVVDGPDGFRFELVSARALSEIDPQRLQETDVVAVLGTRGLEQRGRERLLAFARSGGGLFLTAGPAVEPAVLKQALAGVMATSWTPRERTRASFAPDDARHPIFRPFAGVGGLGNVSFTGTALLDAPAPVRVIARFDDGTPALAEERSAAGRVLVFGSDLNNEWNDFPLQPAFLPFVHEALRYLASPRVARTEYVVGEVAGAAGRVPGVVRIPAGPADRTEPGRRVAVNVDPREADPSRMTADAFQSAVSRLGAGAEREAHADARNEESGQSLWRYGLLLMVVSLAAEGLLGRRLG